jgi:hypothetical protein
VATFKAENSEVAPCGHSRGFHVPPGRWSSGGRVGCGRVLGPGISRPRSGRWHVREVQVQPNHVTNFLDEIGIRRELERLVEVGLEPEGSPDPADRRLRKSTGLGHAPCAPVGGRLGLGFQRSGDDLLDPGVSNSSRCSGSGFIGQPIESVLKKTSPPFPHDGQRDAKVGGDGRVGLSVGGGQHDLGTQRPSLSRGRPTGLSDELGPFVIGENKGSERPSEWHEYLLREPYQQTRKCARDNQRISNSGH